MKLFKKGFLRIFVCFIGISFSTEASAGPLMDAVKDFETIFQYAKSFGRRSLRASGVSPADAQDIMDITYYTFTFGSGFVSMILSGGKIILAPLE